MSAYTINLHLLLALFSIATVLLLCVIVLYHLRGHGSVVEMRLVIMFCYATLLLEVVQIILLTSVYNSQVSKQWGMVIQFVALFIFISSIISGWYIARVAYNHAFEKKLDIESICNRVRIRCFIISFFSAAVSVALDYWAQSVPSGLSLEYIFLILVIAVLEFLFPLVFLCYSLFYCAKIRLEQQLQMSLNQQRLNQQLVVFPLIMIGCQIWTLIFNIYQSLFKNDGFDEILFYLATYMISFMGILIFIQYINMLPLPIITAPTISTSHLSQLLQDSKSFRMDDSDELMFGSKFGNESSQFCFVKESNKL